MGAEGGSQDTKILLREDTTALMSAGAEGTVDKYVVLRRRRGFWEFWARINSNVDPRNVL